MFDKLPRPERPRPACRQGRYCLSSLHERADTLVLGSMYSLSHSSPPKYSILGGVFYERI